MGMDVFMFSDNVPVEEEIRLKRYARDHGLLMMGPDCGLSFINGVGHRACAAKSAGARWESRRPVEAACRRS